MSQSHSGWSPVLGAGLHLRLTVGGGAGADNPIEGEVLTPEFIERVLDTVFLPYDLDRPGLELEREQRERQIACREGSRQAVSTSTRIDDVSTMGD